MAGLVLEIFRGIIVNIGKSDTLPPKYPGFPASLEKPRDLLIPGHLPGAATEPPAPGIHTGLRPHPPYLPGRWDF